MHWYVNDLSLQGQFENLQSFERALRAILAARARVTNLRTNLRTTRMLRDRLVSPFLSARAAIQLSKDIDFKRRVLGWLDRSGPFIEDDRLTEDHDYFEYESIDVTDAALGEAARRSKAQESVAVFSFSGGAISFEKTPLYVDHGLQGDRLGRYGVENFWEVDQLIESAVQRYTPVTSWKLLIEHSRERFPKLLIPDSIYQDSRLAREPFDAVIRDRVLALLGHLNSYMLDRMPNGAEGRTAQGIVRDYFTGERALFSGESTSNRIAFHKELKFTDPIDPSKKIFAHWHGKINHRFFRVHFEWPVPKGSDTLKVMYLGPKITKA